MSTTIAKYKVYQVTEHTVPHQPNYKVVNDIAIPEFDAISDAQDWIMVQNVGVEKYMIRTVPVIKE